MPNFLLVPLMAIAALLVVVLPALVLLGWLLMIHRERTTPPVNLCKGADVRDPASKPCWVSQEDDFCPRHVGRVTEPAAA